MYTLRDLLVGGPVVIATSLLRDAGIGWCLCLLAALLLYGALRFIASATGLEQAVRDRRAARGAGYLAEEASRAARARANAGGRDGPGSA